MNSQKTCFYCKELGHVKSDCSKFRTRQCYKCGKIGHSKRQCEQWHQIEKKRVEMNRQREIQRQACKNCWGYQGAFKNRQECRKKDREYYQRHCQGSDLCQKCYKNGHKTECCLIKFRGTWMQQYLKREHQKKKNL